MFKSLKTSLRTIALLVAVVCLGLLAHGGVLSSDMMNKLGVLDFEGLYGKLVPIGVNILMAALFLSVSYLFYKPLRTALAKTLDRTSATDRGKLLLMRTMKLSYWAITVFVVATVVAPEILSKMFLGASIMSAAFALSLQGVASDLWCGIFIQVTRRYQVGDMVEVIGMEKVKGKIMDVGYVSTVVKVADGLVSVPNREMWVKPTKISQEEKKSLLILPDGFKDERKKKD